MLLAGAAVPACVPAMGTDAATADATLDAAASDVVLVADATDAADAVDVPADVPDCAFVCLQREVYIDGGIVNYVEFGDGATSFDATCDVPPPTDPRCGFT